MTSCYLAFPEPLGRPTFGALGSTGGA
ncbi:hypothetical protein LCGC14_3004730, partial [marine sediment metagenome]